MIGRDSGRHTNEATLSAGPFYMLPKALTDVFQPHMRPADFAVYAVLARRENLTASANNSMRELATAANISPATVLRSIETLVHLGLIKRTRRGGSQADEYRLANVLEAAKKWNATYDKLSVSYSLSRENMKRLRGAVTSKRTKQPDRGGAPGTPPGVSPLKRQRSCGKHQRATRETQTGTHLLQEERRREEDPTPNPPRHECEMQKSKDSPDEDRTDPDLKWAQVEFTGVIKDLGVHLLDTSRPPNPRFANGAADWNEFGFNSLAVEAAEWRGETLELCLSARDPAAARRGLEKYHRTFDASLRAWYRCEVKIALVKSY
jgi:predicted transcriptional regulator